MIHSYATNRFYFFKENEKLDNLVGVYKFILLKLLLVKIRK